VTPAPAPGRERYDVVILGGAFAGAATALLLRRELPGLSVLVVEKSRRFDSRVGEATTEMSAMFLTRRLALWQHLEREHLPKEGLRYWFANDSVHGHAEASETGGYVRSTVPSFQLRRDALDQHLLDLASAAGAEVARPARARAVRVGELDHEVEIETGDGSADGVAAVACRWLIDATGRARVLGRELGLIERNERHPIASMWCRWRGVRHLDDVAAREAGGLAAGNVASRRLSTNHYPGRGFWVWFIPLGNGETSVGIVWDRRLVNLHERPDREAAYREFLEQLRPASELLGGAEMRGNDFRYYSDLAYVARSYAGPGWALVGDAAAFLDPYYSPGLDHAAFTVEATLELIREDAAGTLTPGRIARHNEAFVRSYHRFFEAVYEGKYEYMGEADLLSAAMLVDTAQYYVFVVVPAYRRYQRFPWMPVLGPKEAFFAYYFLRFVHRRLRRLAELRRATGEESRRNAGRRIRLYFDLGFAPWRMGLGGTRLWLTAELDGLRLQVKKAFGAKGISVQDKDKDRSKSERRS
jgi:flavin-dependent dehydrogenase